MKIIDLSQTLENGMQVFPGDPEVKIEQVHTIENEGWRLKYLQFSSHVGTHVDALAHMDKNGETLDQLPIDRFIGKTVLVSTNDEFPKNMGLAFCDGDINNEVVEKILASSPKFVAIGSSALFSIESERTLLQAGIITITDLVSMEELPKNKPFTFYAVPLKIKDGDGSPVRAFAVVE